MLIERERTGKHGLFIFFSNFLNMFINEEVIFNYYIFRRYSFMNTNNYHKVRDITLIGKAVAATATAATGIITLVKAVKGINNNCKQKVVETKEEVKEVQETTTTEEVIAEEKTETE